MALLDAMPGEEVPDSAAGMNPGFRRDGITSTIARSEDNQCIATTSRSPFIVHPHIISLILSFVTDDPTLGRCMSVSRLFFTAAAPMLYEYLEIGQGRVYMLDGTTRNGPTKDPLLGFRSMIDLGESGEAADSQRNILAQHVKALRLIDGSSKPQVATPFQAVPDLVFPNLKTVVISHWEQVNKNNPNYDVIKRSGPRSVILDWNPLSKTYSELPEIQRTGMASIFESVRRVICVYAADDTKMVPCTEFLTRLGPQVDTVAFFFRRLHPRGELPFAIDDPYWMGRDDVIMAARSVVPHVIVAGLVQYHYSYPKVKVLNNDGTVSGPEPNMSTVKEDLLWGIKGDLENEGWKQKILENITFVTVPDFLEDWLEEDEKAYCRLNDNRNLFGLASSHDSASSHEFASSLDDPGHRPPISPVYHVAEGLPPWLIELDKEWALDRQERLMTNGWSQ